MTKSRCVVAVTLLPLVCLPALQITHASESDADAISSNIRQLHMPYGTIFDPIFASPDPGDSTLVGYIRAGDSAIWTGHYLAAEAFRYRVLGVPDALEAVSQALAGISLLVDVTGTDVLARAAVPVNSPYAGDILAHEQGHGVYTNNDESYFWIGNTSRDQYSGVMFGLSVAYEMVDEENIRATVANLVTRLLNTLLRQNWNVVMPSGAVSTTFRLRPDQQLSFLQIGRQVNPQRFDLTYKLYRTVYAGLVGLPIAYDNADPHNSYFKFNLNYINLYSLIRLEEIGSRYRSTYMNAYLSLRGTTEQHGNSHFNMIDRALRGEDSTRDEETLQQLDQWLERPRRDYWVDLTSIHEACADNRACSPVPVNERVNTDFLWQRSPFQLYGGGDGTIETAAIDYLLPYWLARYHGVVPPS